MNPKNTIEIMLDTSGNNLPPHNKHEIILAIFFYRCNHVKT